MDDSVARFWDKYIAKSKNYTANDYSIRIEAISSFTLVQS